MGKDTQEAGIPGDPAPGLEALVAEADSAEYEETVQAEDSEGTGDGVLTRGQFLTEVSAAVLPFWAKGSDGGQDDSPVTPIVLPTVTISEDDTRILRSWLVSIDNKPSIRVYGGAVLDVCEYYGETLSQVTADQWISYIRDVLPKRRSVNALRKLDRASIYVHYYAIKAFLPFYRSLTEGFPTEEEIEGLFPEAPVPPPPAIRDTPDLGEVSAILSYASEHDVRTYTIILLAYECLLTPEEIRVLKVSQVQQSASGVNVLYLPKRREKKFIEIPDDVLQVLSAYIATQFSPDPAEDESVKDSLYLFRNRKGAAFSNQYQASIVHAIQEPLVLSGTINRSYPLSSFRKAGLNRLLSGEASAAEAVAKYAGVTERYANHLKQFALPDMAQMPDKDKKKRRKVRELIALAKDQAGSSADVLDYPVTVYNGAKVIARCPDMASAITLYAELTAEGARGIILAPVIPEKSV